MDKAKMKKKRWKKMFNVFHVLIVDVYTRYVRRKCTDIVDTKEK